MRLDKYLQTKYSLKSRTYAENLIKTGRVFFNGALTTKTSTDVSESDFVEIVTDENFASQGAYKLEEAFKLFNLDVNGLKCVDIGCSNGGFTDCLLRHGAREILAIDVADCALAQHVLDSGRVTFLKANARALPAGIVSYDFVCSDVSFISLKLIMHSVYELLKDGGEGILLIKPQFELQKSALNKRGIVTSDKDRQHAIDSVKSYAQSAKLTVLGISPAPVRFEGKNREYLLYIKKQAF